MQLENPINPIFKLQFSDLYDRKGLLEIDQYFLDFLNQADENLYKEYLDGRLNFKALSPLNHSELLIKVGKILEEFLTLFFDIKSANANLQNQHQKLANLYIAKKLFVQRRVAKNFQDYSRNLDESAMVWLEGLSTDESLFKIEDFELQIANKITQYLSDENQYQNELNLAEQYCAWALYNQDGIKRHQDGFLFKIPKKIIARQDLIKLETTTSGSKKISENHLQGRDGFGLTDQGCSLTKAIGEANYCIYCHNQGKDSCSIGLREKNLKNQDLEATKISESLDKNLFKKDQFGTELSGCPLDEKISEMNLLKSQGKSIAALAMAVVDNPMIAGTGHRICNDCMKSCIYQKQEPVNIPQIETRILKDVLELPFGFEIYSLLTRWNPLNLARILEKEASGYKVLVAGLGPAGYTLAHHLLNEGHLVVAIDGLKIEPLDPKISGIDLAGNRHTFYPIKNVKEIYEELDERTIGGFGGVAEYGITVRWDKNFLKIIRLLLERRNHFRMFGGFRLGSAFDCYDALKDCGFDHVALCLGAGWVKIPEIKNNFLKGIRMASDFLMALQLTGAERENLLSNLQLRLPILVVGSGLTAIDTACEALAYYPKQVENFAKKYQILCQHLGQDVVEKDWNEEDRLIATEFLQHYSLIEEIKENFKNNKAEQKKNITKFLQKLGGAKIIYRKQLQDSPAYRLNHEEMQKAFEEGIEFLENATPIEALSDQFGHIESLKILHLDQELKLSSRSLFLAAGTTPNKAPFYEDKLKFELNGNSFRSIDLFGNKLPIISSPKTDLESGSASQMGFICATNDEGKMVSFFGDLHQSFNGSVVKAMASAKNGYPIISQALQKLPLGDQTNRSLKACEKKVNYQNFINNLNCNWEVKVAQINVLSDYFIELVVHAPLLAQKTKLGHIFRLHNYHSLAKSSSVSNQSNLLETTVDEKTINHKTLLAMEGVAVTTYKVSPQNNTITVMVVNDGGSSSMVKNLKAGEPIIFMGPTGVPTHIFKDKTVLLIAGGRGIFPLAGLAAEYKKQNCRVLLFCGFKDSINLIRREELEESSDQLILAFENNSDAIKTTREKDQIFSGDITCAVAEFFRDNHIKIDVTLTMGNDEMMHKVAELYHLNLKDNLNDCAVGITSLNSPMQCMLKGVCSQCLQRKIDPKTGTEKFFYACLGQDQKLGEIDFNFLKNRCEQNSLAEKITKSWLQIL